MRLSFVYHESVHNWGSLSCYHYTLKNRYIKLLRRASPQLSLQAVFSPTGLCKIRRPTLLGQSQCVFETPSLIHDSVSNPGKKDAYDPSGIVDKGKQDGIIGGLIRERR